MNIDLKKLILTTSLFFGMIFSVNLMAQSTACCAKDKEATAKTAAACTPSASKDATSGCTPSACRGAKTKFGEAKVISDLRTSLIALKADMEKSKTTDFEARSYDIHGIVGESDDESLQIIVDEVKIIEASFAKNLNHQSPKFILPENKAKQVQYLSARINKLKKVL